MHKDSLIILGFIAALFIVLVVDKTPEGRDVEANVGIGAVSVILLLSAGAILLTAVFYKVGLNFWALANTP